MEAKGERQLAVNQPPKILNARYSTPTHVSLSLCSFKKIQSLSGFTAGAIHILQSTRHDALAYSIWLCVHCQWMPPPNVKHPMDNSIDIPQEGGGVWSISMCFIDYRRRTGSHNFHVLNDVSAVNVTITFLRTHWRRIWIFPTPPHLFFMT